LTHDVLYYLETSVGPYDLTGTTNAQRRVVYENIATGIESLDIYHPINLDADNDVPIYVIFRGTNDIFDGFVDLDLFADYLGSFITSSEPQFSLYLQLKATMYTAIKNLAIANRTEKIVFVSHSLGSRFAIDLFYDLYLEYAPGGVTTTTSDRLSANVMFNPYILTDYKYQDILDNSTNEFQILNFAHVVQGDPVCALYKNHHVGYMYLYQNLVSDGDEAWTWNTNDLDWAGFLNRRNHNIDSYTDEVTTYPNNAPISWLPHSTDIVVANRVLIDLHYYNSFDVRATLRARANDPNLVISQPELDSTWYETEIKLNFQMGDKTRMYLTDNGEWSFPFTIQGLFTNTGYFKHFHFIKAYLSNNTQYYYFAEMINYNQALSTHALSYYTLTPSTEHIHPGVNYSQETLEYSNQMREAHDTAVDTDTGLGTITQTDLSTYQAQGETNNSNLFAQWDISQLIEPLTSNRRVFTEPFSYLPRHGKYYRIRNKYFNQRYLSIFRRAPNFATGGRVMGIVQGSVYAPSNTNDTSDIFECIYDLDTGKYQFVDVKFRNNSSDPTNSANIIKLGGGNIFNFSVTPGTYPSTNPSFHLDPDTVNNSSDYFGLRSDETNLYMYNAVAEFPTYWDSSWGALVDTPSDGNGAIDPIGYFAVPLDVNSLWKFEPVSNI
jgi:hypothetical protein